MVITTKTHFSPQDPPCWQGPWPLLCVQCSVCGGRDRRVDWTVSAQADGHVVWLWQEVMSCYILSSYVKFHHVMLFQCHALSCIDGWGKYLYTHNGAVLTGKYHLRQMPEKKCWLCFFNSYLKFCMFSVFKKSFIFTSHHPFTYVACHCVVHSFFNNFCKNKAFAAVWNTKTIKKKPQSYSQLSVLFFFKKCLWLYILMFQGQSELRINQEQNRL